MGTLRLTAEDILILYFLLPQPQALMDNPSFLYLLIFPARKMMKVGKANNIHVRIQSLRRFWGEVDYEHSYRIALQQSEVFKLEKMLHFLLAKYQTGIDAGDGYTELFSIDA